MAVLENETEGEGRGAEVDAVKSTSHHGLAIHEAMEVS